MERYMNPNHTLEQSWPRTVSANTTLPSGQDVSFESTVFDTVGVIPEEVVKFAFADSECNLSDYAGCEVCVRTPLGQLSVFVVNPDTLEIERPEW